MLKHGWILMTLVFLVAGCSKKQPPPEAAGPSGGATAARPAPAESLTPVPIQAVAADSVGEASAASSQEAADSLRPQLSTLAWLPALAGQSPFDVQLWRTVPTARRLYKLLGAEKYERFLINMQESTAILGDKGVYYVLGNKKFGGGGDLAAFVADVERDYLYVWLLLEGTPEEHVEAGWKAPLPQPVREFIQKAAAR